MTTKQLTNNFLLALLLFTNLVMAADSSSLDSKAKTKTKKGDGKALIGIAHRVVERPNVEQPNAEQLTDTSNNKPRWVYQIQFVMPNSAAHKANIMAGDLLLSWDGLTLDEISTDQRQTQLKNYLKENKRIGDPLIVEIERKLAWIDDGKKAKKLLNFEALQSYLKHPNKNQQLQITLDYQRHQFSKTLTLGRRFDEVTLPANKLLFPELSIINSTVESLSQQIINKAGNKQAYQDLLTRFEDNQKWQQGYRLKRFRYLHRQPEKVLLASNYLASQFINLSDKPYAITRQLQEMANWLDEPIRRQLPKANDFPRSEQLEDHWHYLEAVVGQARKLRDQAFEKLSNSQQQWLYKQLPKLLGRFSQSFYINISEQQSEQSINTENLTTLNYLQKIDYKPLIQAALVLSQLNNPNWHKQLKNNAKKWFSQHSAVTKQTPFGLFIIASEADQSHYQAATIMIDLGGDDRYFGGTNPQQNPISLTIDLGGDDIYSSSVPHAQASALMGVSLLYDWQGNDDYIGSYYSQAVAIAGIAALVDYQGADEYWGQRYSQAAAFWGLALLHDKQGDDRYQSWLYGQGVGGPKGMGLLLDDNGNDVYHATGDDRSSYQTQGNFRSSSQGFGSGFRGYASGGIGVLIDRSGKDQYRAGNFSMGTGYFYGMGLLYDAGNDDDTFQASRYGMAAAAHSAIGAFINEGGQDKYRGNLIALASAAWDLSITAFWDKQGNDQYLFGSNSFNLGVAAHNSHSIFLDSAGSDTYQLKAQHKAIHDNDYHGGYSFALMIDGAGQDSYSNSLQANQQLRTQQTNGFMLDWQQPPHKQPIIDFSTIKKRPFPN